MNTRLKFHQTPTQKVFWTSDTHCYHNPKWEVPIWKQRGYESAEQHTDGIVREINNTVGAWDILFHLGDITLNCSETQFEELLSRINCQNIYMLWGNHTSPSWGIYQREVGKVATGLSLADTVEIYPFRYRNLIFLGNYAEAIVDGQYFVLSHYPIHVWHKMQNGSFHLTGHSHYGLPFSREDNLGAKIMDVGWDAIGRPFSTPEILSIMAKKEIFRAGDHHQ